MACSYTIRTLTQLALTRQDGYVLMSELCDDDNDLPRHFVAKTLQRLVHRGLLRSAKGRGGGFALARPPDQISLYEIVDSIDGTADFDECVVGMVTCDDDQPCPMHDEFKPIRAKIKRFLLQTTLDSMSKALQHKKQAVGKK
jgi:Rrf2 family protein